MVLVQEVEHVYVGRGYDGLVVGYAMKEGRLTLQDVGGVCWEGGEGGQGEREGKERGREGEREGGEGEREGGEGEREGGEGEREARREGGRKGEEGREGGREGETEKDNTKIIMPAILTTPHLEHEAPSRCSELSWSWPVTALASHSPPQPESNTQSCCTG